MSRFSGCNELRVWGLKNWDGSTASNSYQLRTSVFLFRLRGMPQRGARALPRTRNGGKPGNLLRTRHATPVQRARVPPERAGGLHGATAPRAPATQDWRGEDGASAWASVSAWASPPPRDGAPSRPSIATSDGPPGDFHRRPPRSAAP